MRTISTTGAASVWGAMGRDAVTVRLGAAGLAMGGNAGVKSRSTIAGNGAIGGGSGMVSDALTVPGLAGCGEVGPAAAPGDTVSESGATRVWCGKYQPATAATVMPMTSRSHSTDRERAGTLGLDGNSASTRAVGAAAEAALAFMAARRAFASGDMAERRSRDSVRGAPPAPAMTSGWVIVAS
ncbi:MAG: hypothetical protein ACREX7_05740 [Casimicrobiaceae bacterium]